MRRKVFASEWSADYHWQNHPGSSNLNFSLNDAPKSNLRSPAALARFFLTAAAGLFLDLYSKHLAFIKLAVGVPYREVANDGRLRWIVRPRSEYIPTHGYQFIKDWIHFHLTVNEGAVFGIGQGQRWLFLVISAAAIWFLTFLFSTSGKQRFFQVLLGMLLAGVLGNLYDRFQFGYVRDMIYALPGWHWPGSKNEVFPWIFNVADILLCVGVALTFIYSLFNHKSMEESAKVDAAT